MARRRDQECRDHVVKFAKKNTNRGWNVGIVQVLIRDGAFTRRCTSGGDPHIRTFDGQ